MDNFQLYENAIESLIKWGWIQSTIDISRIHNPITILEIAIES